MRKVESIEAIRGFAALYVFLGHLLILNFGKETPWISIFLFGQEAVILFFLVSGFVIMHSVETSQSKAFLPYISRRFFRIYPIFVLSLLVSGILSKTEPNIRDLLGNLFMLQDFSYGKPGVVVDTFAGNAPLWSLSYEWWFYLAFYPVFRYIPERGQLPTITLAAVAAIGTYNVIHFQPLLFVAYFPIWWSGAEIGRAISSGSMIPFKRIGLALAAITIAFSAPVFESLAHHRGFSFGLHPVLEFRHAAASLVFMLILWVATCVRIPGLAHLARPFLWIAPISYGLYALHFPLITAFLAFDMPVLARVLITILAAFTMAWIAEVPYQKAILKLRADWNGRYLIRS